MDHTESVRIACEALHAIGKIVLPRHDDRRMVAGNVIMQAAFVASHISPTSIHSPDTIDAFDAALRAPTDAFSIADDDDGIGAAIRAEALRAVARLALALCHDAGSPRIAWTATHAWTNVIDEARYPPRVVSVRRLLDRMGLYNWPD